MIIIKAIVKLVSFGIALFTLMSLVLMTSCSQKISVQANEVFTFPYKDHVTLTWWYKYEDTYFGDAFTKLEEHPYMKRMEQRTNVAMDITLSTATSLAATRDEAQAMIAAGDCTDMVSHAAFSLSTEGNTVDAYINEEIYLCLNDYVEVQMPNFNALRDEYSIIDKLTISPQGNIVFIPKLFDLENYRNSTQTNGLVIRKDKLDEIQEDVPETIDDWYRVLTKFKQMGIQYPIAVGNWNVFGIPVMDNDMFITAFDQLNELYLDKETGQIRYGIVGDGMRQYVTIFHQWYEEGLLGIIDATSTQKLSEDVGAWQGSYNDFLNLPKLANEGWSIVAAPDPVVNRGDHVTYRGYSSPVGSHTINCVYLSYDCSQPAIAAKWIDQMFSEEAYMETSYGVLDEDYTIDDAGNIKLTDKILGNADGARYGIAQNCFLESFYHDPYVVAKYAYDEATKAACAVWSTATSENSINKNFLVKTEEEQEQIAALGSFYSANTSLYNFIKGTEPLTAWDEYVARMNQQGIEELISIEQTALDRYLAS